MILNKIKKNELLKRLAMELFETASEYSKLLSNLESNIKLVYFHHPDHLEQMCIARRRKHNVLCDCVNILCRNFRKIYNEDCPLLKELNIDDRNSVASWAIHSSYEKALKQLKI